jgi:lipopolysaccharide heptosyltransferase II
MNIKLMKTIDRIFGTLLARLMSPLPKGDDLIPHSLLIIRPGGIGDAVLLIPAINALKDHFPDIRITVLAEKRNASTFKLCPHVNEVLHYDKPKELLKALRWSYDVVIDTEQWHRLSAVVARLIRPAISIGYATNEREKLFTHPVSYSHDDYEAVSFLKLLTPLGIEVATEIMTPFFIVPETSRCNSGTLLESLQGRPFVTIFPGASIPERRWGTERFAAVAQRLSAEGIAVVVVGGQGEQTDGDRIVAGSCGLNLAGKTSLTETAAIVEKSSVLLTGDSGVLHMAVGLGTPTVSLFGPGISKKWAPKGAGHVVINKDLPCSPCTRFGYTPKCPINAKCLADVTVDEVFDAVARQFLVFGF